MRALLYGVTAYDLTTLALTVVVLGGTAVVACIGPAFRAARVEAREALD
jgi:ABC-type antimicrobial peptide transport system permease subunit